MAKSKTVSNKAAKIKLESKILKRKSLKKKAPLLKKLTKTQIKETILPESPPESPTFLQFEDDTIESGDDTNLNQTGLLVKAPNTSIDKDQTKRGVKTLFKYISKTNEKKTELFDDEQSIFLQITAVKVPKTPNRQIRLSLAHSLLSDNSEICLIVKDIGHPKDYDGTIEHYQKLLIDHDITNIKTIMPFHEFKSEYGNQFELKRKLLGLYDYFLVDGKVSRYVVHLLGRIFLEKRKMPTSINMEAANLKDHVEKALRKTIMKMHSNGDSYLVQVGHSKMADEEVFENICDIIDELDHAFPGGVDNIRRLDLKTEKSIPIPIYLTLKKKNIVNVPVVLPKRPKQYQNVTGELTTLLHKDVTVLPSGKVVLVDRNKTKNGGEGEDSDFSESNISDEEQEETELYEGQFQSSSDDNDDGSEEEETREVTKKVKDDKKPEIEELLEEEDDLVEAEQLYLNEYEQSKVHGPKSTKSIKYESKKKVNKKQQINQNQTNENIGENQQKRRTSKRGKLDNSTKESTVDDKDKMTVKESNKTKRMGTVKETINTKAVSTKQAKSKKTKMDNTARVTEETNDIKSNNAIAEDIPADFPVKKGRKTKAKDVINQIPTKKNKKMLTDEVIVKNNNKPEKTDSKTQKVKDVPLQKGSKKTKRGEAVAVNENVNKNIVKSKKGSKGKKLL